MSHGHPYSVVLNEYGVPTAVHPMPTQLLPSLMRPDGAYDQADDDCPTCGTDHTDGTD